MSNKPVAVVLLERKDKAVKKLSNLQDKIDAEQEITENNLGYELTRAVVGLEANRAHLTTADRLLQQAVTEEMEAAAIVESVEEARLQEIKAAELTFNTAKEKYERALILIKLKYNTKGGKVVAKVSEKLTLLRERVKRCESAVKLSEESVERLRNNVPKSITRAKYAAKQPQRELATLEYIKDMSKKQKEDMIERRPVPGATRQMPDDDGFDAYFSKATGIDMSSLARDRAAAIAADKKKMPYSAHKPEEIPPDEEVFMFNGKRVSKFEYERFTRPAPVQEPVQEPVEEPVEDEDTEIDDDQLARDIEEAKQRQRHTLLQIPKKPVKVIKKSDPSL